MFRACLLALAVCMDTFLASASCSFSGIQIPKKCALLISLTGTVFLTLSLTGAEILNQLLPEQVFKTIGFLILCLLGSSQILKNFLTAFFEKHRPHWNWKALGLVIDICFDETLADTDHSKTLSLKESVIYSAVLSLDSLASGLGAGIERNWIPVCLIFTFSAGYVLTLLGCRIGKIFPMKINLSWIGGILLLFLAFYRL